jgi:N-acetylglutamate synthase-like GNAT family acetyltransferase
MSVRHATDADVPAVRALVDAAYRGDASRAGWTTEADLLDGQRTDETLVRELLVAPDSAVLLLEEGGALLACCHVEQRPGVGYVGMVAVAPGRQGRGTGRRLLEAAERQLVAWALPAAEMTVLAQRPELLAWYARRGYLPTGERRPFPYGDERYGRPRRPDLELLVLRKPLGGG